MSGKSDDKDDGYETAVGFSVPIKRVLGHEERSENPDGSRTGSLFMTLEGCTFKEGELHGSAAATVGAPSVVVEIEGKERDHLTTSKTSSRYIVDVHDIVQVALAAHKARMTNEISQSDGLQFHARRWNTGHSSTADLQRAAIEYARVVDPRLTYTLRRLARLVWIKVGKANNPLLYQMLSNGHNDRDVDERFMTWNTTQVELGRALYRVVFGGADPDLGLINRALDFFES